MKLQVTQENLSRALNSVARVASSRGTLPILANVLIKTSKNRLSLAATNLDIAITHYIGGKVSEEGSITVPARLMQDFVSSLPGGIINLELEDTKLHVSTDQYKSVVNGIIADDFPVMPALNDGKNLEIKGPEFKKALQQIVFAASSDETRPVLTGVLLHNNNGNLFMAATDSYRLAEKNLGKIKEDVKLLVPGSAMAELLRVIGDDVETVQIKSDDQQAQFKVGDVELVTRQVDGNYPDYQKLIPSNFAVTASLKKADLTNVTKVSSLFARESAGSVTIEISEEKQSLSIRSIASQLGENTSTATANASGSGSVTINSRYLLDALNVFSGDQIDLCFNGKLEPVLLREPGKSDYVHIVMPLKS
jgi:DNA polymerase-3 subunit beta